jgi:hypothetical protein
MKDLNEIQKVHDMLVAVVLGDTPKVKLHGGAHIGARCAIDVLNWVLEGTAGNAFQQNVDRIKQSLEEAGYKIVEIRKRKGTDNSFDERLN